MLVTRERQEKRRETSRGHKGRRQEETEERTNEVGNLQSCIYKRGMGVIKA